MCLFINSTSNSKIICIVNKYWKISEEKNNIDKKDTRNIKIKKKLFVIFI